MRGLLLLLLVGCAGMTPQEESAALWNDVQILGDELVIAHPEYADEWAAISAGWAAYLTGDGSAALALAGDQLVLELAGDDSQDAALMRAALRILLRRAGVTQ